MGKGCQIYSFILISTDTFYHFVQVVIADINVKVGRETEEELKESYGEKKIEFMPCDVAGKEQLECEYSTHVTREIKLC